MGRAYKQRSRQVPDLLGKYSIKPQKASGPKNVIFIVVDCLRKDHLSLYGYERETTPFLKTLADKAAVFENALAPTSWTYPSVASMLTGLYPHNHGGMHTDDCPENLKDRNPISSLPNRVRQDILFLPELLLPSGFKSYFSSAMTPAALAASGGFKNADVFFSGAAHHLNNVLKYLRNREHTFVYVHLADLHDPINVPVEYMDTFGKIADIPNLELWQFKEDAQPGELNFERYRQNRSKLYDCALRSVDAQLAGLFRRLEKMQLLDSSLVFITADHGEEFWEHLEVERLLFYDPNSYAGISHGHNLFQEIINVPLLCIGPGVTPGCYSHNVSLVDLVPTVLDICGIEHKLALDGRNLFDPSHGRVLISEGICFSFEKKAVIKDNWKLIHSKGDGVSLLFDLSQDPREEHNLAEINAEKLHELNALLPKAEVKSEPLEIDRDIKDQLRYLGYM